MTRPPGFDTLRGMRSDRRRSSDRVSAELAVRFEDGEAGETRNISPTGVFLVVEKNITAGMPIRFSIEFQAAPANLGSLYLECVGEVVRAEDVAGKLGVGIRITESKLERRDVVARHQEMRAAAAANGAEPQAVNEK